MLITAAEPRRQSQYEIYLDGQPAGLIDAGTWELSGYRPGGELSREEFDALWEASGYARAKSYALYLLGRRGYSQKELYGKISQRYGGYAAQRAVDRMTELGLLDDMDYARRRAKDLIRLKHYSGDRVMLELLRMGIEREQAKLVLEEIEMDPAEQIRELLDRKYSRQLGDEKGRRRTIVALQRLGYRWDEIKKALEDYPGTEAEEFEE